MKGINICEYQRLTHYYNALKKEVANQNVAEEITAIQKKLESTYLDYALLMQKIERLVKEYDSAFQEYRKELKLYKKTGNQFNEE